MKVHIHVIPVHAESPPEPALQPPYSSVSSTPLWHYTTGLKLRGILQAGEIKPSTAHLDPGEKPVVWFSSRPTWEPTATKCPLPGKLGQYITARAQDGLVRICVPACAAPHSFRHLHAIAGTSPQTCVGLVLSGLEMGADPGDWFFSPTSVSAALFRSIEGYDFTTDSWLALDMAELVGQS
jgi:hypothetical protein